MTAFDPRLYLVTDPDLLGVRSLVDVVRAAVAGGATLVQLRDKAAEGRALAEAARALVAALAPTGVPLLVNDRVDVALAAGAQGVHLGQRDLAPGDARRMLGPGAIIGLSIEALGELDAPLDDVDYVAASPVFATATKADVAPPLGLAGVAAMHARAGRPVVGIGGIGAANAAAVMAAGAAGIAVVSAILAAPDPRAAAAELRRVMEVPR